MTYELGDAKERLVKVERELERLKKLRRGAEEEYAGERRILEEEEKN
jgi:hypothetical protein